DQLTAAGIDLHIQIVLVPGLNDADVLDDTLRWLAHPARRQHIASVGIVPVAYTDHSPADQPRRSFNDEESARAVIAQVQREQFRQREETGQTWVHLADEFYVYANAPFPTIEWYDDFPQYENGIGIILNFVADVREQYDELRAAIWQLPAGHDAVTLMCGELARDTMLGTLSALEAGGRIRLLPVRNRFFGGNVSVTALLAAQDVLHACVYDSEALRRKSEHSTIYVVPDALFNSEGVSLDDWTRDELLDRAGAAGLDMRLYDTSVTGFLSVLRALNRGDEEARP
ncbi:MAG: DUF512 domain-containing protein, partial [Actinomycetes bacterium]|nr:DUF512 domain-containing protein [Actinomycetes bacterium]